MRFCLGWELQFGTGYPGPRGCTCSFYIRGSPSETKNFTPKRSLISVRAPKNVSMDRKFLTNVARIFFKIVFINEFFLLRNQYPLTQKYHTRTTLFHPKISDDTPLCLISECSPWDPGYGVPVPLSYSKQYTNNNDSIFSNLGSNFSEKKIFWIQ